MVTSALGVSASVAATIEADYTMRSCPSPAVALGALGTDVAFACRALAVEETLVRYIPFVPPRPVETYYAAEHHWSFWG